MQRGIFLAIVKQIEMELLPQGDKEIFLNGKFLHLKKIFTATNKRLEEMAAGPPAVPPSTPPKGTKGSVAREWYNLPRAATTILDFSAALRQGLPLAFSKEWRGAWKEMLQSWGSEGAYQKVLTDLKNRPIFQSEIDMNTGKVE